MAYGLKTTRPDKNKWYQVRGSNNLSELRKWKKWAEKNSGNQKFIIVDNNAVIKKEQPQDLEYFKMREKAGLEDKYNVYGTY